MATWYESTKIGESSKGLAAESHATRKHAHCQQNSGSRRMVGGRSQAGGVMRRNHFTSTCNHDFTPTPRADCRPAGAGRYYIKVDGELVGLGNGTGAGWATFTQAASQAASLGGHVVCL